MCATLAGRIFLPQETPPGNKQKSTTLKGGDEWVSPLAFYVNNIRYLLREAPQKETPGEAKREPGEEVINHPADPHSLLLQWSKENKSWHSIKNLTAN